MKVRTVADAAAAARAAARRIAAAVELRPELVLGLPTGRTMVPLYGELARRHAAGELALGRARAFNLDELLLPRDHPASFRAYMARHAWERIGLDRARCEIPDAEAEATAECRRYEGALAAAGGLDLAILGLGADGHIAYNLPGPPESVTHVVTLPTPLADQLQVPADWRPLRAITLGLGAFLGARQLLVLATTADKLEAVRALLASRPDPRWPCSLLAGHAALELLLTPESTPPPGGDPGQPERQSAGT